MDTQTYRDALTTERDTVTAELNRIAQYNTQTGDWEAKPAEPADDADPNDAADDAEDATERQALVADLETRFRNIERALLKMDNENYGNCELCGKTIEAARLSVNPAARTCIADRERESELTL